MILITGGAGFIGKEVGKTVDGKVYDLATDTGNILDPHELAGAMEGCEAVIHLAAMLGVENTDNRALECLHINIQGTINVLEACIKMNIRRIVFVSSSEVYGKQDKFPITEDAPLNPKSPYAVSKVAGEEYVKSYSKKYDLDYNIVRLFNVYGANQREDFVIPRFVKLVKEGKPPTIYGPGEQIRCFSHVSDVAIGIAKAVYSWRSKEVFNLGNPEAVSMKDLAYKVISLSGKIISPTFISYDNSDRKEDREITKRIPSIEKARNLLNYDPTVSLSEGLKLCQK